jgi:hypothetical protein
MGKFIEFTNTGPAGRQSGWSFDDDSENPGTVDLSAFGVVAPGQSVILNRGRGDRLCHRLGPHRRGHRRRQRGDLGRNDEINLYDADDNLIDQ